MTAPVLNYTQFAGKHGFATDYDVQGHLHAGLRCAPQTKTYQSWYKKRLQELWESREQGLIAYWSAVGAGEISAPHALSRLERLQKSASGHQDLPSTQAAKRLLAEHYGLYLAEIGRPDCLSASATEGEE